MLIPVAAPGAAFGSVVECFPTTRACSVVSVTRLVLSPSGPS
jgi:hypothetical protein